MQPTYWRLRLLSLGGSTGPADARPLPCAGRRCAGSGQRPGRPCRTLRRQFPRPRALSIAPDVQPLRPFGHVIGDVITQRVALDHEGRQLDPEALPELERVGNWFQRRDVRIERDAGGRRWLVIDYQIINVPDELRALDLPALDLPTKTRYPACAWRLRRAAGDRRAADAGCGAGTRRPGRDAAGRARRRASTPRRYERRLHFGAVRRRCAGWPLWLALATCCASSTRGATACRSRARQRDMRAPGCRDRPRSGAACTARSTIPPVRWCAVTTCVHCSPARRG
jgi:hypothetical protein